jgi:hypothetical protein
MNYQYQIKYDEQDQQGQAADNERNPHTAQHQRLSDPFN